MTHRIRPALSTQGGISLVESMVAIVVMALGILGVLGVQLRTLADTQAGVRRAQALRLIEDLSERLKTHPNALGQAEAYVLPWASALPQTTDCQTSSREIEVLCDAAGLRAFDLHRWLQGVRAQLPHGDATLFLPQPSSRQLGVMLAWHENEKPGTALPRVSPGDDRLPECPSGRQCHLQYLSLSQRCLPDREQPMLVHCAQ